MARETSYQMTINEQRVGRFLSELSDIEFGSQRLLDNDSLRLIAEFGSRKLLTEEEWTQSKSNSFFEKH
jgi:hypothetical protein